MSEDLACSLCGMAGHTARSPACPIRAFTGEPSTATDQEGKGFLILLCLELQRSIAVSEVIIALDSSKAELLALSRAPYLQKTAGTPMPLEGGA